MDWQSLWTISSGTPCPRGIHLTESELRNCEALVSGAAKPLCGFGVVMRDNLAKLAPTVWTNHVRSLVQGGTCKLIAILHPDAS